ncbi:MAG: hypothetical protein ACE5K4_02120 [Candidatus Hydrothermarchaeota archaeon]
MDATINLKKSYDNMNIEGTKVFPSARVIMPSLFSKFFPDICHGCFKRSPLENWGEYRYCEDCGNMRRKKFASANPDFEVRPVNFAIPVKGIAYNMDEGIFEIVNFLTEDFENLIKGLIHECVHHVIHLRVGVRECYQFDNLPKKWFENED